MTNRLLHTIQSALFLFFFFLIFTSTAQVTRIRGIVFDKETKELLPFVNIALDGTNIGTISGFDGSFFLETRVSANKISASYIGYVKWDTIVLPGTYQKFEIYLQPETIEISEVVVKPGENPAHRILQNLIDRKELNDPTRIGSYKYEVYNKMELDVNNISEDYKNQKVFNKFQFIFDYIDTSAVTGKTFLPIFITESLSDFYYQKQPKKQKEIIKASNISGVDDNSLTDFTGQMYLDFNIYNNFVPIMGLDMVSPIANFGTIYYKYYLIDSAYRDNHWCYHISFEPKRKQEPTFTGYFWVQDTTFAIQNYKISLAEGVNINYVQNFVAEQTYTLIGDSVWFPKKQELFVDFVVTNKEYGFFGRKTTSYDKIVLYPLIQTGFFSNQVAQETVTKADALTYTPDQWQEFRPDSLSKRERDIYLMVDSIQEVPLYNSIVDVINTIVTGYWVKDYIEIGPYYTLYSFNPIEGSRFKLGMRTSNKFSTKVMFNWHLAYGTKDQKLKYGLGMVYMFNKNPRRRAGFNYSMDYEQLGTTDYAFLSDNFLSSIFSRETNDKLTQSKQFSTFYEHEWFQGYSNTLSFLNKRIYSSPTVPFMSIDENSDTTYAESLVTSEIKLNSRFAFNEKYLMGEFDRVSLGTTYPIINLNLTTGIQGVFGSDYNYLKLNISLEQRFPIHPIGDFRYIVDAGRIFGDAPYPFLQIHEGNQTYAFDDYAYNLMNYYEFISNQYVSLMIEHHFNGLFLNHIPLMRKLKWREIVETKILAGDLTTRSSDAIMFPPEANDLNIPYMEAGFGIENMFKFFRADAIWRLTYKDNPDILPFGVFVKMQIMF